MAPRRYGPSELQELLGRPGTSEVNRAGLAIVLLIVTTLLDGAATAA